VSRTAGEQNDEPGQEPGRKGRAIFILSSWFPIADLTFRPSVYTACEGLRPVPQSINAEKLEPKHSFYNLDSK
jgi:hypothetical protein